VTELPPFSFERNLFWEESIEKTSRDRASCFLGSCLFLSWGPFGQLSNKDAPPPVITLEGMSPQDLQLFRRDIRKRKQKFVAENLPMSESEAVKFWAVYGKACGGPGRSRRTRNFDASHVFPEVAIHVERRCADFHTALAGAGRKPGSALLQILPLGRDSLPARKQPLFPNG
jgi:hypothetical protein